AEIKSLRSIKDTARMGRDAWRFLFGKITQQRRMLKDPFAVFSAKWFAQQLGCQVVITVRHPAAFISSLKRLGWSFNFNDLLNQRLLMRDWLASFEDEIKDLQSKPNDVILRGALLWRMIYHVVHQYQQENQPFLIVRHKDLSLSPINEFKNLYKKLNILYTPKAQTGIRIATQFGNPAEVSEKSVHSVKLDSHANIFNWKKRLNPEEIDRIRESTADVAAHYYTDEDWA
ncbi:MAG: hypothetical protein N2D54_02405, partial [Chloroflexota bacterium]